MFSNKVDPPLTKLGLSQAERTGEFLAKFCPRKGAMDVDEKIQENMHHLGFDAFVIETSPMIRCIQTACKIAEKLGVSKIKINYQYFTKPHFKLIN